MHCGWWRQWFYCKFKAGSAHKLFSFSVADLSLQAICPLSIFLSSLANTLISPKCCHCGLEYFQWKRAQKEERNCRKNVWKQQKSRSSFEKSSYQFFHGPQQIVLELCREIYSDSAVITVSQQELYSHLSACCQTAACQMQRWDVFLSHRKEEGVRGGSPLCLLAS